MMAIGLGHPYLGISATRPAPGWEPSAGIPPPGAPFSPPSGAPVKPRARREGLEVQSFHDELVVYDLSTDRAHVLHPVVAHLWNECDGTRTVTELVESVRAFLDPAFERDAAWAALDALWDAGLILEKPAPPAGERRISRREMVRDVAAAGALGMTSGVVGSILVPMPLQAQSGGSYSGDPEMGQMLAELMAMGEPTPEEEKKEEETKKEEPPKE
ncbi:MAG: PqqD family peptide modification chaperone, partial [Gemmatimonadetes bacterium]|nr:PqqD family peptide modification chaperone [Gemmatimonadota bacterium]